MSGFPEYTGTFSGNADAGTQNVNEIERREEPAGASARPDREQSAEATQAIHDLEKLEKFRYQGKEWTAKDLEKAILRQQDYTRKTQSLSDERKTYETERQSDEKYYNNLHWDLLAVANNPNLAAKFLELYPEKFHTYLKDTLSKASGTQSNQGNNNVNQQNQTPDIEMMSKVQKLEKFYDEQQTAKTTTEINKSIEKYSKEYKDAIPELVIGRVYEAYNNGTKVDDSLWSETFKQVDNEMKQMLRDRYGSLVKEQKKANAKGRDVDSGSGTISNAPQKFKSIGDVTKNALKEITGR
jgi:hypothetical protein